MRLSILRHAPSVTGGRLAGRRDVPADCSDHAALTRAAARVGTHDQIVCSAALRCRQTAQALGLVWDRLDPKLWEQDFGAWEGLPADRLPDLGPLPTVELARHRPDGGESFDDLAARITPALQSLDRDSLLVAHAGTVRAALSLVVGQAALSFAVAPLSLTILHRHGDLWSVEAVNLPVSKD
ncbi:histidine phosphatase family protein [Paracoccus sp. JM45]|uniref:histidine phosphatase family protein n=1 Tax=Paracoccus sp. JM45 TaxID=2283626 RepID=UPI000E6C3E82|nr:histidine phosphatase family protein [Paracoccus sp. JM45]RJE79757.1 histidine phosphatase family protein [Paracoccus sp. JM45]